MRTDPMGHASDAGTYRAMTRLGSVGGVLVVGALLVVGWAGSAGATSRAGTVAPLPYLHVVVPPKGLDDATPY
ncbi:MAG TPA: hypothetical protein VH012_08345, partial [Acidimicrobiales bacterium]|nr:hypothetical protein [Acidimicrobiales bacterium]